MKSNIIQSRLYSKNLVCNDKLYFAIADIQQETCAIAKITARCAIYECLSCLFTESD